MRASSEARRWGQEATRRRSRSPERTSTTTPGNRGRRWSQDTVCRCWDCEHRMTRSMATMEELREESGTRKLRVQAT